LPLGGHARVTSANSRAQHQVGAEAALQPRHNISMADCGATLQNDAVSSPANQPLTKILFVSHTYAEGVFKVGSHHLTRELARMGLDVAHISTPFSMAHALFAPREPQRNRLVREGVRVDESGVRHLIPRSILPAQYSSAAYLARALKAVAMERPQLVFVDQPLMLCGMLFNLGATTIYRPTDLYLEGPARRLQSGYVGRFNGVAATSEEVLGKLPTVSGQRRTVIPNGVEYSRFRAADAATLRAGAVYVGALDHRFDWDAVTSMGRAFPNLKISLVGPVTSVPAGLPTNVEIRGPMDYAAIPQYLARFSIGLLPLSTDPSNVGRSPMKLFEYLAAGLHVVATGVRGLTSRTDLPGCFFYADGTEAHDALARAMAADGVNTAGIESARAQDWREKAKQLLHFAQSTGAPLTATRGADCIAR
jgi:teichuronic acid biosynthesis glycosyltransferase TuaH